MTYDDIRALMEPSAEDRKRLAGEAMMQFGLGVLANNTNRRNPFPALGAGGLMGMQSYRQGLDQLRGDKLQDFKIQQLLDEVKQRQARQAALQNFRDQLPEKMRPVFDVAPEQVMGQMFKEPPKPQLVTVDTPQGPMQKWVVPGQPDGVDIGPVAQKDGALPWYVRKGADGSISIDPAYAELEKTKASFGRPPAQPIQPVAYVDPSSGQTVWGTIAEAKGKPAANYNPAVQGAVAGAKEEATTKVKTGAEARKAMKASDQLLSVANQASALLEKNPTQSGIGSMVDSAGRVFGMTSESSKVASELEAISGWLVANVPRMEGPQSNFDVENYRTMAGKVGDRTIPVEERKRALARVVELQEKYKALNQSQVGQATENQQIRRYNPETGRIE